MTDEDKELVANMRETISEWMEDEPFDDWFLYQRDFAKAADRIEAQAAEIEKLRGKLRHANEAHWFYYGDDCSSDACRMDIHECIDEDFEWDNKPEGDHVLLISGARPVPDMWVALHYFTEEEKDARQDDEPYTYTVHATQAEAEEMIEAARAAFGETK